MRTFCPNCAERRPTDADHCDDCGAALERAPEDTPIGVVLDDKYFITAALGRGGVGAVYRARQRSMDRDVAIKVLAPERIADEKAIARFKREARAVSLLSHPNIITVHDFGTTQEIHYLVMELIEGEPLSRVVAPKRPLPFARAVSIVTQICDALAEAHDQGIVHRDLKSQNVMITPQRGNPDFVKVLDFGLVKIFNANHAAALTEAGRIVGTPAYMSPEQIEDLPVDPRSDLYSVGVILFELLSGQPPFASDDIAATLTRQIHDPLPRLSAINPAVVLPITVDRFLERAMAKDPTSRPASAGAFKHELLELAKAVGGEESETLVAPLPYQVPVLPHIDPDEAEAPTVPDQDPTSGRSLAAERARALAPIDPEPSEPTTLDRRPASAATSDEETELDRPAAEFLTPVEMKARNRKWPRAADRRPRPVLPSGEETKRDARSPFEKPAPRPETVTLELKLGEEPTDRGPTPLHQHAAPAEQAVPRDPPAPRPTPRRLPYVIAVVVVIAGLLWLMTRGDDSNTTERDATLTPATHAVLETRTEPAGAVMLIDGDRACTTPCRVELQRTSEPRTLRFQLDGYQESSREVLLGSALVRVPLVKLTPISN